MKAEVKKPSVTSEAITNVAEVLCDYALNPPAGDSVIASMSAELLELIDSSETARGIFESAFEIRFKRNEVQDPVYLTNLTIRAIQHTVLPKAEQLQYPHAFKTREKWQTVLPALLNGDDETATAELWLCLATRDIQSNKSERYKTLQMLGKLFMSGEISILDLGCSQNQGLTQLALLDEIPFEALKITDIESSIQKDTISKNMNNILHEPLQLSDSWGVDIWPMSDESIKQWVNSCSFRPEELTDQKAVDKFKSINEHEPLPNIHFAHTLYDRSVSAINQVLPSKKFNIISMMTMMYQMPKEERQDFIENALSYLNPGGLLVIQDGMELPSDNEDIVIDEIEFDPALFTVKGGYKVIVSRYKDHGKFQEFGSYDSGRCNEFTFSESKFAHSALRQLIK